MPALALRMLYRDVVIVTRHVRRSIVHYMNVLMCYVLDISVFSREACLI